MSSRPQTTDLYEEDDEPDLGPDERDLDLMDGSWEREYYSGRMKTRNWNAIGAGIGILIGRVRRKRTRVDRSAAYLARGRDLSELGRKGATRTAQRLGVHGTPGIPIGKSIPGGQPLFALYPNLRSGHDAEVHDRRTVFWDDDLQHLDLDTCSKHRTRRR